MSQENKDYFSLPLKTFYITLAADDGPFRIKTVARTREFAIQRVLRDQLAPESAVIEVEEGDESVSGDES